MFVNSKRIEYLLFLKLLQFLLTVTCNKSKLQSVTFLQGENIVVFFKKQLLYQSPQAPYIFISTEFIFQFFTYYA